MNVEINLLPEEFRPRALVETRALLVIVLILALAVGCYLLYQAKSDAEAEIVDLEENIAAVNQQIDTITRDAQALTNSISKLNTVTKSYESFVDSKVTWGDALARVQSDKPSGVTLRELTQKGNTLEIQGTAAGSPSSYSEVTSYGRALDRDTKFTLAGWPTLTSVTFSLTIEVAPGGGR